MLSAVAAVLMFVDFSVPFMPAFIKMDISELPALLASFSIGPWYGVAVCLVKNLINCLRRGTVAGSWAAMLVFLYAFFCTPLLPTVGIWAQQWKTQANGFLLNFMTALRYSFVSAPEGYDRETAEQIAEEVE